MSLNSIMSQKLPDNPISNDIIKSFIQDYGLEDSHYFLWQLLRVGYSGNLQDLTRKEKNNIIDFYKRLELLVTSIYDLEIKNLDLPP